MPLLDEEAILACSLYVDLNPIRAGKADTPETSPYTSAYERIRTLRQREQQQQASSADVPADAVVDIEGNSWLSPIALSDAVVPATQAESNPFPARRASNRGFLSLSLPDYLQLLDWTGRQIRRDKRGAIPDHLAPILERLHLDAGRLPRVVAEFSRLFRSAAGRAASLAREAERTGRRWLHGARVAADIFG